MSSNSSSSLSATPPVSSRLGGLQSDSPSTTATRSPPTVNKSALPPTIITHSLATCLLNPSSGSLLPSPSTPRQFPGWYQRENTPSPPPHTQPPLRSILKKTTSMESGILKSALKSEGSEENAVKKQARIACRRYPSGEMVPKFEYITEKTAGKKHRETGEGDGGISRKRSFDG